MRLRLGDYGCPIRTSSFRKIAVAQAVGLKNPIRPVFVYNDKIKYATSRRRDGYIEYDLELIDNVELSKVFPQLFHNLPAIMVSTRTRTGAIQKKQYDVKALREIEITASPGVLFGEEEPPAKRRRYTKKRPKAAVPSLPPNEVSQFVDAFTIVPSPSDVGDKREDIPVFPSLAFGRREETGMSRIMRADREVETWEEIRRVHQKHMPHLLPMIDNRLERAIDARNQLSDTPENIQIGIKDEDKLRVFTRIHLLEKLLETSTFKPERENVIAAIEGYKSGHITYDKEVYTIIYAGRIVDTAPDYASFNVNRKERLDQYAALHGHHWLWYESPLKVHADALPRLAGTSQLVRENRGDGSGCYYINQGFWKRTDWVARLPGMDNFQQVPDSSKFAQLADGRVYCQEEGPRLSFRCMLDSGANHPLLFKNDLDALGIDPEYYAAQSLVEYCTPSGEMTSRVYELFVYILDEKNNSIVDKDNPVWPLGVRACGSVFPVCVNDKPMELVDGVEVNTRLSGILPFISCYLSSTPTNNVLFLGEDRRDVLGTHRMPGQRKWDISMPYRTPLTDPRWASYDNPITTFTHNVGRVIDEDLAGRHGSRLTINKGTNLEISIENIPGQASNMSINPLQTLNDPSKAGPAQMPPAPLPKPLESDSGYNSPHPLF